MLLIALDQYLLEREEEYYDYHQRVNYFRAFFFKRKKVCLYGKTNATGTCKTQGDKNFVLQDTMSSNPSLREFAKDLYRLLQLPRTATQIEIKRSYREMALTLHPDRHHVRGGGVSSGDGGYSLVDNVTATTYTQQQQTTAAEQARKVTNERKTAQFKEVSEAYRILSDITLRREYDRWLDTVDITLDGIVNKRGVSSAAECNHNPFYRKVYSPAAPPGMKTFDRQRHYGKRAR